jgi:predicted AlkP superfamily phosphohydrolase/phosphomutase
MWKYHDKRSPLANEYSAQYQGPDPILCIYQKVDQYIGKLCAMASDDTTIMVMSDHGHGGNGVKIIYLNRWLEGLGLLKFKPTTNRTYLASLINVAKKAGLKFLPPTFKKKVFRKTNLANKMESYLRFSNISWTYTKAYSEETPYYPNIWINMEGREPSGIIKPGTEYEEIRQDIIDALYKWVDPETGQQIAKKVYKREQVYSGPFVEKFPDLIIEWVLDNGYSYLFKNSYDSKGPQIPIRRVNEDEKDKFKSGDHRDYGILIASGKTIQKQTALRGAEIIDLAPTILYLLGLPIPADMDGKVLTQLFSDEQLSTHPIRYRDGSRPDVSLPEPPQDYSEAEEEAVRARLQGLGYVE